MSCIQIIILVTWFFVNSFVFFLGPWIQQFLWHCIVRLLLFSFLFDHWMNCNAIITFQFNSCLCAPTKIFFEKKMKMKWNKRNKFMIIFLLYEVVLLKAEKNHIAIQHVNEWTNVARKGKMPPIVRRNIRTHTHAAAHMLLLWPNIENSYTHKHTHTQMVELFWNMRSPDERKKVTTNGSSTTLVIHTLTYTFVYERIKTMP